MFESDYPLTLAKNGLAILIDDVKLPVKEESQQGEDRKENSFLELSKSIQNKEQRTLTLSNEENKLSEE